MYAVYLIVNEVGDKYIGFTSDLESRLKSHNEGFTKSTEGHKWKLAYAEMYLSEKDARIREKKLKQHGQGKRHMYERAKNSIDAIGKVECWEDAAEGRIGDWGEVVTR